MPLKRCWAVNNQGRRRRRSEPQTEKEGSAVKVQEKRLTELEEATAWPKGTEKARRSALNNKSVLRSGKVAAKASRKQRERIWE